MTSIFRRAGRANFACVCLLMAVLAVACGDSPTRPTPTPTPAPRATVVQDSWGYVLCVQAFPYCDVHVFVRNQGPDCAGTVRGTTTFYRDTPNGPQAGSASWAFLPTTVLRVGEVLASPYIAGYSA